VAEILLKDIPILYSTAMVQALLEGRKHMTRRLLYSDREVKGGLVPAMANMLEGYPPPRGHVGRFCSLSGWQNAKPGDRLWVKEGLRKFNREPRPTCQYVTDMTGQSPRWPAICPNFGRALATHALPRCSCSTSSAIWSAARCVQATSSLTSLREKLIKIGAKIVRHGRYVIFQMGDATSPTLKALQF
jgi:hypothetical protein